MTSRRGFIAGLLATSLAPAPSWADLGGPAFLAAAKTPQGGYLLAGLSDQGAIRFTCPLPGRGHAAAAHPQRPEAVAFAFVAGVQPLVGLYAAFIVGLITAVFGGRPGMISGATGALAVVMRPPSDAGSEGALPVAAR